MRKIVVCFERLNFEKSVQAVDEKQDISLLWPYGHAHVKVLQYQLSMTILHISLGRSSRNLALIPRFILLVGHSTPTPHALKPCTQKASQS